MGTETASTIQNFLSTYGIMIVLIVLFIVVAILPQRKRDKQVKQMMEGMKVGDMIKTIGGFYGKIVQIKEDVVTFECGPDKTKMVISKGAIATVENAEVENEATLDIGDKK